MYKNTKKRAKYLYDSAHSLIQKIKIKGNKFTILERKIQMVS